ncbi:MAG TPA: ABC transporter substrate-binding protein [Bacillota bacterium]|nr:ABC transporter substrate-binding protein [Bacillota bacterium]
MRRFIKASLMLLLMIAFVVGCSSDDDTNEPSDGGEGTSEESTEGDTENVPTGGTIDVAFSAQPATFDPHMTTAVATSDVVRNVYETLVTIDDNHEFIPMLADTYEISDDGLEITFNLREGVLFHNGKEMTSEDVVASMERWQEKSSTGQDQFADAEFIADGDYTVILKLPEQLSTALSVLSANMGAFPAIMPKEVVEGASETGVEEFIGTGPFTFEEWTQDVSVHMKKFDDYVAREEEADGLGGKKEALVDDIYFHFVSDPSTRLAGMLSGEYDVGHAIPHDNYDQVEGNDMLDVHIVPGSSQIITFNKKKGMFSDKAAREAVMLALDMDDLMQAAFAQEEFYEINHNLVMPYLSGLFDSDIGKELYETQDLDRAKEIIEENGWTGEEITILSTRDYDEVYQFTVVMQERLEQIGLNVDLDVIDWPTFLERKEDEDAFDLLAVGFGPQPEPTSYLFLMEGPHSGWTDDQEFHDLIDEFRAQPTLEDTADAYDEMMAWNEEHIPFIKIGDNNRIAVTQSTLKNFKFVDGFVLWNVYKEE